MIFFMFACLYVPYQRKESGYPPVFKGFAYCPGLAFSTPPSRYFRLTMRTEHPLLPPSNFYTLYVNTTDCAEIKSIPLEEPGPPHPHIYSGPVR